MVSKLHCVIIIFFCILLTVNGVVGGRSNKFGGSKNDTNIRGQAVFIGASITQWWLTEGLPIWSKYFGPLGGVNVGVAGDGTQQTIDRLNFGYIDSFAPVAKVAVLNIGNNDLSRGHSVEYVDEQIGKILDLLKTKLPQAKVILLQILPRCCLDIHVKARSVNELIRKYEDGQNIFFLDMEHKFCSGLGQVYPKLYQLDHIHLSLAGYRMWAETMEPLFNSTFYHDESV